MLVVKQGNASEAILAIVYRGLVAAVKIRTVYGTPHISEVNVLVHFIERYTDSLLHVSNAFIKKTTAQGNSNVAHLMQVPRQDIELGSSVHFAVATASSTDIGPVDRVSNRIFATVCPVEDFGA